MRRGGRVRDLSESTRRGGLRAERSASTPNVSSAVYSQDFGISPPSQARRVAPPHIALPCLADDPGRLLVLPNTMVACDVQNPRVLNGSVGCRGHFLSIAEAAYDLFF